MSKLASSAANPDDNAALERMVELVYRQLRQLAHHRLQGTRATLNTTALVHECVARMLQLSSFTVEDRAQFLGYASRAMRAVLVDHARRRLSQRRGAGAPHLEFDNALDSVISPEKERELLRVHDALAELEARDPRLRQVVEMRYFGGLSDAEIGAALGLSTRTVQREWDKARRLLHAVMSDE